MGSSLSFNAVWRSFDQLLSGLALGLGLAAASIAIGAAIGIAAALGATSGSRATRWTVAGYVTLIRNTPILILVLIAYFGLPQIGIRAGRIESFVGALAIYAGAYLAEVFRAGLLGVPAGVLEAARALGLRPFAVAWTVTLPLMLRNALPALGSTFISLFKDTSLAAAIAIPELTFEARKINVETFRVIETWLVTTGLYVATCLVIAAALRRLEKRFPAF